jgi:GNAT superfamily N-acetyltransferase
MPKRPWDVPTLQAIFTLEHPHFFCTPTVVELDTDHFWIVGSITAADRRIAGSFVRRIVRRSGTWVALHENFEVKPEYRRRGIAFSHYRKALRAYRDVGCARVEMLAFEYGPFVWPQFGFRCRNLKDRRDIAAALDRLHRLTTGRELPYVPQREWELVAVRSFSGEPIGLEAARRIAERHPSGAFPMVLDLNDGATRSYLVDRGIFGPEVIR